VELASNQEKYTLLRNKLESNRGAAPLFDTPRFARDFENVLAQVYERSHSNMQPAHILPRS
jgi:predicted O-linked N-acetylglucosamine transferase (SPINDLY family)